MSGDAKYFVLDQFFQFLSNMGFDKCDLVHNMETILNAGSEKKSYAAL